MPTWIYICAEHGALFRTARGKDGHQRRLSCHPRKLRPAEQRKVSVITRADLKDEVVRGLVSHLESWEASE